MQKIVDEWSKKYAINAPRVESHQGDHSFYNRKTKKIYLSSKSQNPEFTLAHEYAHHMRIETKQKEALFESFKSHSFIYTNIYAQATTIPLIFLFFFKTNFLSFIILVGIIAFFMSKPPFYYLYILREEFLADCLAMEILGKKRLQHIYSYNEIPFVWIFCLSHPHQRLRNIYLYNSSIRKKLKKLSLFKWFVFNIIFHIREDIKFLQEKLR